jgi:hypothetical protein
MKQTLRILVAALALAPALAFAEGTATTGSPTTPPAAEASKTDTATPVTGKDAKPPVADEKKAGDKKTESKKGEEKKADEVVPTPSGKATDAPKTPTEEKK